jgi:hypothetical protein
MHIQIKYRKVKIAGTCIDIMIMITHSQIKFPKMAKTVSTLCMEYTAQ